eukprot:3941739-Rhodomonas_salina.2
MENWDGLGGPYSRECIKYSLDWCQEASLLLVSWELGVRIFNAVDPRAEEQRLRSDWQKLLHSFIENWRTDFPIIQ